MQTRSLLSTILVAVSIGSAVPVVAQTVAPDPRVCVVQHVDGITEVSDRGANARPASVGLGLGRNAILRTEAGARITMSCSGGLKIVLGPDSEVEVFGLLSGGSRPFGLRLIDGIAGFLFSSDAGNGVQVRTPSAVAAVRSTEWAMQVKDRASAVFAREGIVFVFANGENKRLDPGEGIDVAPSGTMGNVTAWGQARIDQFDALLGSDW